MFTTVEDFTAVLDKPDHGIKAKYNFKGSMYLTKELSFSILNPQYEEKTGNLKGFVQKLPNFQCRGFLNEALYGSLKGCGIQWGFKTYISALHIEDHPIILVLDDKMSDEHLEKTLILLNSLEDKAGWERSVSYKIEPVEEGEAKTVLIGPNNWLRGTPYLSLYSLILRCTARTKYNPAESPAEFFKKYKNAAYQQINYRTATATSDTKYWTSLFKDDDDILDLLLANQDRILGKDSFEFMRGKIEHKPQNYIHHCGIFTFIETARELIESKSKDGDFAKDRGVLNKLDYLCDDNFAIDFIRPFYLSFAEVLYERKQEKSRVL